MRKLIFGLVDQLKKLDATDGHYTIHNIEHTKGLTSVVSVYDGIKPAHMVLSELYEWAEENNEELRLNNRTTRENNKRLRSQNKQLKTMKIYRIVVLDMMGFRINELFFISLEKARSEYAKILIEYRNKENIVQHGDESHLSSPIVKGESNQESVIKEHMIELWYKTSYECDEWDTSVESIQLEIINFA